MELWTLEEENGDTVRLRRRRPLAWISLAAVLGTALGVGMAGTFPTGWVLGTAVAGVLLLLGMVGRDGSQWGVLVLVFALAAVHAHQEVWEAGDEQFARRVKPGGEFAAFEAVALEDAVFRPAGGHRASAGIFSARVERLNRRGVWEDCDGTIRVNLQGVGPNTPLPRYGERWRCRGVVTPAHSIRSGVFGMARNEAVVSPDRAELLETGQGNCFMEWCAARRRACRDVLAHGLGDDPVAAGVLQALLLGYRENLPEELRENFAATGTIHIFAISGAHVGMVCMLLNLLLGFLTVPKTRRVWVIAPCLAVYVAMTGMATSAVRAAVMAGAFALAPALRRRGDGMTSLAFAAALILAFSPRQIADVGFLLSFSAVWGILTLNPLLERAVLKRICPPDWRLRDGDETGEPRVPMWVSGVKSAVLGVTVWVTTMPLTLLVFQMCAPVALGMNIVVIPAALCILTAGVLSLGVSWMGAAGAWAGETFNLAGGAIARALTGAIGAAVRIPHGHFYLPAPPWWGVALWMGIIAVCAWRARRGSRRALPAMWLALAFLAAAGWGWHATKTRVWVLGAAPGQAVLVESRGERILVDAGPTYRANSVLRELRELGVNDLRALVLTHPDAQHSGAAAEVLEAHPAAEVWVPRLRWKVPQFEAWLAELRDRGTTVRELVRGERGEWGNVHWEVLWPPAAMTMKRGDDASLVLHLSRGGRAILLAGDFGAPQEELYLSRLAAAGTERTELPAAAVLVLGRHGAADASGEAWLRAVNPRLAIASGANGKDERLPSPELVERVEGLGIEFRVAPPREITPVPWLDPAPPAESAGEGEEKP